MPQTNASAYGAKKPITTPTNAKSSDKSPGAAKYTATPSVAPEITAAIHQAREPRVPWVPRQDLLRADSWNAMRSHFLVRRDGNLTAVC